VRQRYYPGSGGTAAGLLDGLLGGIVPPPGSTNRWRRLRPLRIRSADLWQWRPLPRGFPVFIRYQGFGTALATHHLVLLGGTAPGTGLPLSDIFGGNPVHYFAVHKYTPYGVTVREPYGQGMYAVPAFMTRRMPLAVAYVLPQENIVVLDDSKGREFTVQYTDFMSSRRQDYTLARRALQRQYPEIAGTAMSLVLLPEPPADMAPVPVVTPDVIRNTPAVLVSQTPASQSAAEPTTQEETVVEVQQ